MRGGWTGEAGLMTIKFLTFLEWVNNNKALLDELADEQIVCPECNGEGEVDAFWEKQGKTERVTGQWVSVTMQAEGAA
jgi:RecJ-like exonuclease